MSYLEHGTGVRDTHFVVFRKNEVRKDLFNNFAYIVQCESSIF